MARVKKEKTVFFFRHGRQWDDFRSQVQQVMLQSGAARQYVGPLNQVADDFMAR